MAASALAPPVHTTYVLRKDGTVCARIEQRFRQVSVKELASPDEAGRSVLGLEVASLMFQKAQVAWTVA